MSWRRGVQCGVRAVGSLGLWGYLITYRLHSYEGSLSFAAMYFFVYYFTLHTESAYRPVRGTESAYRVVVSGCPVYGSLHPGKEQRTELPTGVSSVPTGR